MLKRMLVHRPPASLVISMVALFVALSGWGYAATGGSFLLGKGNSAGKTTALSSQVKGGPTLAVGNTGGKPAASFKVKSGVPPFTVNSSAKVANLNADLLDGLDSSALQQQVTGAAWGLNGNAGTSAESFLGTTDANALVIKTNDEEALRVSDSGDVGVGTVSPVAKLEAFSTDDIGLAGTSTSRAVLGRLGEISCPGTYAVGGCAGDTGAVGVFGSSTSGTAVSGASTSGIGVRAQSDTNRAVDGSSKTGIGVAGDSTVRGVVGTLNGVACPGAFGVGGCDGVSSGFLADNKRGVIGTLNLVGCPGVYGVGGCAGASGDGVLGVSAVPANSFTAAAVRAWNSAAGDIFLGESGASRVRVARIDGSGKGYFDGGTQSSGADYAESVRAIDAAALEPGDVLAIDPARGFVVRKSSERGSALVVGVYSTRPSVLAVGSHRVDDSLTGEVPVAMVGVVPTKVTTENGPIRAGDLLTTSSTPGYAMRAKPLVVRGVDIYPTGAILGKALTPLRHGTGVVEILLMLR